MSDCAVIREQMPMLLVEALDPASREEAHRHIEECHGCGGAWSDARETWTLLGEVEELPLPAALRQRFHDHIRGFDSRGGSKVVPFRPRSWRPLAQIAATLLLVAAGFLAGQRAVSFEEAPQLAGAGASTYRLAESVTVPAAAIALPADGRASITNVRFIDRPGEEVAMTFDVTSRVTVTGLPEEKSFVDLVSHLMRDGGSGLERSEAIQWVRDTYGNRSASDPAIVDALASVLQNDSHEGVRIKAAETLRSLRQEVGSAGEHALIEALRNDPNPAVRIKAVEALADLARSRNQLDQRSLETLREKATQDDENPYVRVKAAEALSQIDL